jgi:hypothetical protein
MKAILRFLFVCATAGLYVGPLAFADTLVFSTGHTVSGTVIQTNGDDLLVLTPYAAYNFSRSNIKEIKTEPAGAARSAVGNAFPDFHQTILFLSKQSWATNLTPIPATVIDKGILRNVPYSSFRCGEDYEINIYGDLDQPSGLEIGIYRNLLDSKLAQNHCVAFISDLLSQSADKELVRGLDLKKDLKTRGSLTFEVTPPSAEDSYNGWWISVYSEQQLNLSRASDAEMKQITISKADVAKQPSRQDSPAWSADELKLARPSPATITFTNNSGFLVSNAEVRVRDPGVSIIWSTSNGNAGVVKLAELPEPLRTRFGYDPAKAEAAAALEKEKRAQLRQTLAAQAARAARQSQDSAAAQSFGASPQFYDSDYSSGGTYSGGGSVFVHGYYRSNGSYVNGYTRRR